MKHKHDQRGFHHFILLVAVVVISVVGLVGWRVASHKKSSLRSLESSIDLSTGVRKGQCKNDPSAMFTHDFTEPDKLGIISPPVITPNNIRDRAWPGVDTTKTDKVTIYAPADVDLTSGIYKVEKLGHTNYDYDLWFQLSCQRWFFINHISDPVNKIRKLFPDKPRTEATNGTSATAGRTAVNPIVHFSSGELIGYTTGTSEAHNFDLGVFDLNHQNTLPANFTGDTREKNFICPFNLFPSDIKAKYYAILARSPKEAGSVCPQ